MPLPYLDTPSPQQVMVLHIIRSEFAGELDSTTENLDRIREMIGWKTRSSVYDSLRALRMKGRLVSLGPVTRPYLWKVVEDDA